MGRVAWRWWEVIAEFIRKKNPEINLETVLLKVGSKQTLNRKLQLAILLYVYVCIHAATRVCCWCCYLIMCVDHKRGRISPLPFRCDFRRALNIFVALSYKKTPRKKRVVVEDDLSAKHKSRRHLQRKEKKGFLEAWSCKSRAKKKSKKESLILILLWSRCEVGNDKSHYAILNWEKLLGPNLFSIGTSIYTYVLFLALFRSLLL